MAWSERETSKETASGDKSQQLLSSRGLRRNCSVLELPHAHTSPVSVTAAQCEWPPRVSGTRKAALNIGTLYGCSASPVP